MNTRRTTTQRIGLLIAVSLMLSACLPSTTTVITPTATAKPSATPTVAPTLTPEPTITPTPAAIEPSWWRECVFYEIFVRSFYDSDGDGIGDLAGISQKLDYLNDGDPSSGDDLGVTCIWLMPVMESNSYHGYDVIDYLSIESDYGGREAFDAFIDAAHARGMRIIVDFPINHTSDQHPWFVEASTNADSPYYAWYLWSDEDPGYAGPWGQRVWHPLGDRYYYGLFWGGMPDLNFTIDETTNQIYEVTRYWLEELRGDGFRLDAIQHLIEDGKQQAGTPQTHAWLSDYRKFYRGINPDAMTVGEVMADSVEVIPYVAQDEIDLAFEFDLADALLSSLESGDPGWFGYILKLAEAGFPSSRYATFLTNHDQNRVMTQLNGDQGKARVAATALLTLPGVPFIYYGEEIGMTGQKPDELIRTPLQWSAADGAGFTTGQPWQAVNADYATVNIAAQSVDPDSLLSHYRTLIALRNQHKALQLGRLIPLSSTCQPVFAYLRSYEEEHSLTVLNFKGEPQEGCSLSMEPGPLTPGLYTALDGQSGAEVFSLTVEADGSISEAALPETLPPFTSLVLMLVPAK